MDYTIQRQHYITPEMLFAVSETTKADIIKAKVLYNQRKGIAPERIGARSSLAKPASMLHSKY